MDDNVRCRLVVFKGRRYEPRKPGDIGTLKRGNRHCDCRTRSAGSEAPYSLRVGPRHLRRLGAGQDVQLRNCRAGCRRRIAEPVAEGLADRYRKETGGTVKHPVPLRAARKAFDHYDMARDGIADFTYVNPGYHPAAFRSSRPVSCRSCRQRQRWQRGAGCLVPQVCRPGNEGRGTSASRSCWIPAPGTPQKDRPAGGIPWRERSAVECHMGAFVTLLGRDQRASLGTEARDMWKRGVAMRSPSPGDPSCCRHRQGGRNTTWICR